MNEFNKDSLQRIGGSMIKLRVKRMKQTLHALLMELQEDKLT